MSNRTKATIHEIHLTSPTLTGEIRLDNPIGKSIYPARVVTQSRPPAPFRCPSFYDKGHDISTCGFCRGRERVWNGSSWVNPNDAGCSVLPSSPIRKNRDSTVVAVPGEGTKHTGKDQDDVCTCPECFPSPSDPSDWRKACRVVQVKDGGYVVVDETGFYWLGASQPTWDLDYLHVSEWTASTHDSEDSARASLASCPTPPPSWKGTTCTSSTSPSNGSASPSCSGAESASPAPSPSGSSRTSGEACDCGKIEHGRHHTMCPASGVKYSDKEEKPSPALRPANEVCRNICHAQAWADGIKFLTADRVAVLEWAISELKRHGQLQTFVGCAMYNLISELRRQA